MKVILIIFFTLIYTLSFTQNEYPKIELNDKGEKVVVFTLNQAQKIDNDLEILSILEKSKIDSDSLNLSYIKVINSQNAQIILFEKSISELEYKTKDKDTQINNLYTQIENLNESNRMCDNQKSNKDIQIQNLQNDLEIEKTKKWLFGGSGIIIGILTILITR